MLHPELFGRRGEVAWRQPGSVDGYVALRAAELQHHAAVELFRRLEAQQRTIAWLEAQAGIAGGRLSKLLRGHAQLTLRDLQAIEGVIGPVLVALRFKRTPIEDSDLRSRFVQDADRWGPLAD